MYQTLQQVLQEFQSFVENWSFQSTPSGSASTPSGAGAESGAVSGDVEGRSALRSEQGTEQSLMQAFAELKQAWTEHQSGYLKQIELQGDEAPSSSEEADSDSTGTSLMPYGQALHTEMHKQFRLIEVDVLFLKTARQARTAAQRQRQICNRLITLIDYCETGIKLSQQVRQQGE